jgi:hypothetical protein
MMRIVKNCIAAFAAIFLSGCQFFEQMKLSENALSIPVAGNTKVSHTGKLRLFMKAKAADGASELSVSCKGKKFTFTIDETEETIRPVGKATVAEPCYIRDDKGNTQYIEGVFTCDATARAQVRPDYAGGVDGDYFFLKNGGFFNDNTELNSIFTRLPKNNMTGIDLDKLPGFSVTTKQILI